MDYNTFNALGYEARKRLEAKWDAEAMANAKKTLKRAEARRKLAKANGVVSSARAMVDAEARANTKLGKRLREDKAFFDSRLLAVMETQRIAKSQRTTGRV